MPVTRFPARALNTADRVAGFMAHLRLNGLSVGVAETEAALQALVEIDSADSSQVRSAMKAICADNSDRFSRFDELFTAYWMNAGRQRDATTPTSPHQDTASASRSRFGIPDETKRSQSTGNRDQPDEQQGTDEAGISGEGRLVASRIHQAERQDLREFVSPEDIKRAEQVAERLARSIRDRRSRRRRMARRGAGLDFRRTVRASISSGGEPVRLFRTRQPDRPVHLVALLDVSGSMTVYARVFLAFLKGLVSADQRTDAYLFHTRLVRISDALRDRDTLRAVNRLSLMADGFGGGTRIGKNLARFNDQYAARMINGRSVVIILSDGYDTDPPAMIAEQLQRLKKRGCRIVWINPLMGWKNYEPVARGMTAALPHLDHFAPANTLAKLGQLEPYLARI